ncbi:hypothetical protein [Nocardia sp. MW-W600-9]
MGEKTPWDGAAGKASIRIETGAALQAANACHDVIAVLKGCQDLLKPGALNNYSVDAIGGEEVHAKPLRDKFIEETTQASDTVGKFIDALHDMGDMFKAAGAVYTGNDSLTASEIAALNGKKDTLSKVSTSPAGLPLKDTVAKAPGYLPPALPDARGQLHGVRRRYRRRQEAEREDGARHRGELGRVQESRPRTIEHVVEGPAEPR